MRCLVITTVGEGHSMWSWHDAGTDVVLIDYTLNQTFKYPGIYDRLQSMSLSEWDYYWMPDEDISLSRDKLQAMFASMEEHSLDLAQPSIVDAEDSFPSWKRFIHREGDDILPTDFVEVMCPIFSRRALKLCIDTFPMSLSGWGLDLAWSKIVSVAGMKIAIINSVAAKHTRPVGGGDLYEALKKVGVRPSREKKKLMKAYGITNPSILDK